MTAYTTRMPAAIVGAVSRFTNDSQIEQVMIYGSAPPTAYGTLVKLNGDKAQALASADAATVIYGWAVRPYPEQSATNAAGVAIPPTSGILDVMRRGYLGVKVAVGTPAKNGQVYVVTTAGGTVNIGDIVTSASPAGGGTAVAVAGATFMGPADANGLCEIFQKY